MSLELGHCIFQTVATIQFVNREDRGLDTSSAGRYNTSVFYFKPLF